MIQFDEPIIIQVEGCQHLKNARQTWTEISKQ